MSRTAFSLAAALLIAAGTSAFAQDEKPTVIPFAGGKLTIKQTKEQEKVLAFNGKELAHNYVVLYDRTIELQGTKVALFSVGNGGNACGPSTVIVWKPAGGELKTETVGKECGSPPAAVTQDGLFFVPYLRPGETAELQSWTPDEGLRVSGELAYVPQPGTSWADLDPAKATHPYDLFANSDFYEAAKKVLGDKLADVALALSVSGGLDRTANGIFYGSGCIPHSCGEGNGFVAFDPEAKAVYFAQQTETSPDAWPPLDTWPAEIRTAMTRSFNQ
ncbi:hypothetical protein M2281_001954 [Mesorhizobium soli]|uniref:hypothetical protein n=1 Tax=Pseudaminobacter soli (ex Li et al. 2025) TaxID=1295366 RepID=UPI002474FD9C|nr:hypothetical protein [Mesorhizobium soli]MDH6231382.1 hypothetical protein [Mesorhizobium soli]